MTRIRLLLFFTVLLLNFSAQAQYASISGLVLDKETNHTIKGVSLRLEKEGVSIVTNDEGFFFIELPARTTDLVVAFSGYLSKTLYLPEIEGDTVINIRLQRDLLMDGVVGDHTIKSENLLTDPIAGRVDVGRTTMKEIPTFLGLQDAAKGLQMLPGIDFGSDDGTDIFVRGGEAGENLITLGGAPIYSMRHLYGYFSNFDPNAINNIEVYKGVAPSRFGGRGSSIIAIDPRKGNTEEVEGSLGFDLVMAHLNANMPLNNKGASMSLNMRRSYIDILLAPFLTDDLDFAFGDITLGMHFPLKNNAGLEIDYFHSSDAYGFTLRDDSSSVDYKFLEDLKNNTVSVKYHKLYKPNIMAALTAYYTGFAQLRTLEELNLDPNPGDPRRVLTSLKMFSGETGLNLDLTHFYSNEHTLRYGWQNAIRLLNTGGLTEERFNIVNRQLSMDAIGSDKIESSLESAFYLEDDWKINSSWRANLGVRLPVYVAENKFGVYLEPRASIRKMVDSVSSIKFFYGWNHQFVHLYSNGTTTFDNVIWIPSTDRIKPLSTHQFGASYVRNLSDDVQWQNDVYYKYSSNLPLYIIGDPENFFDYEENIEVGIGKTYGFETLLRKNHGNFSGWIGYALSWANREFEDINGGESFPATTDKRHQVKLHWNFSASQVVFSGNLILGTGSPFSIPVSKFRDIEGQTVVSYDQINNYRGKVYQRADISLKYSWGNRVNNHTVDITLYNVTNRENPYAIQAFLDSDVPGNVYRAYNVYNFKFVPSVAYRLTL